jgi:hypothetical protein
MRLRAVAAVCSILALAGCSTIPDTQQVDRVRLLDSLATRLNNTSRLTYTANYQLSGGATATVAQAQNPLRLAYTYPDGKFMITQDKVADCRTVNRATTCTLTVPPSPDTDSTARLLADVGIGGLLPPSSVARLLTAAAVSSNVVVRQHDTTIAGEHATCVDVTGVENAPASTVQVCVTTAGVLGSFVGTVNSTRIEVSLTRFEETVPENAFDAPAGARIVDHRPGH